MNSDATQHSVRLWFVSNEICKMYLDLHTVLTHDKLTHGPWPAMPRRHATLAIGIATATVRVALAATALALATTMALAATTPSPSPTPPLKLNIDAPAIQTATHKSTAHAAGAATIAATSTSPSWWYEFHRSDNPPRGVGMASGDVSDYTPARTNSIRSGLVGWYSARGVTVTAQ